MSKRVQRTRVGVVVLLALLLAVGVMHPQPASTQSDAIATLKQISDAYANLAERVMPSVVTITASKKVQQQAMQNPFQQMFPDWFGGPNMRQQAPQQPREFTVQGLGSGVIVDAENGYILTNEHVVGDFKEFQVRLFDGREYSGETVGSDPDSDLAMIKIEADSLQQAQFGDSDAMRPGDIVMAFGAPFGLEHTVTNGIISAVGRGSVQEGGFGNLIQTSAAINRGNSGGPLVNLDGQVIGINEAIVGQSGSFSGVGLAIPANRARFVVRSLSEHGKVVRGFLGISMSEVSQQEQNIFDLESTDGVLIQRVVPGAPAAKSGLEVGDVIVELDGKRITSMMDFMDEIAQRTPGDKVGLTVQRSGKQQKYTVALGERPEDPNVVATGNAPESDQLEEFGLSVGSIDKSTAKQMGLPNTDGVLVAGVESGSRADRLSVRAGSVILKVNQTRVNSVRELNDALAEGFKKSSRVYLLLRDDTSEQLVPLQR